MKLYKDPTVRPDWGPRPAGRPDQCFYCKRPVGWAHADDCVILCKAVVIEYTIQMVVIVPEHWDEDRVNFHRNESSFCMGNDIEQLAEENNYTEGICNICNRAEAKFLRNATEADIKNLRPEGMEFDKA